MTGTQSLIARAALGAVAACASVLLNSFPRLLAVSAKLFDRTLFAAMAVSRLGLFILIFLVLGVSPRGDVQAFYLPQAEQVLHHHIPYRDFLSSYAPLHPYLDAAFVLLHHSALSIMAASVVAELLLVPLWFRVGRCFVPEPRLRTAALLYLASPISLQFVTIDGQDNVLIGVLLALSLLLLLRHRTLLSGMVFALSVAVLKFLPLVYLPAFAFTMKPRTRWLASAGVFLVSVYGIFLLLHAPVLQPVTAESAMRSASNLPFLVEALFDLSIPTRILDAVLGILLIAIVALLARVGRHTSTAARMHTLTFGIATLTLALLLFAKKSWPPYLMLSLFSICLLPTTGKTKHLRLRTAAFAVFSLAAVTEHSFWATLLHECSSQVLHRLLLAGNHTALLFLFLELVLIAGYLWLLSEALRRVRQSPSIVSPPAVDSRRAVRYY